MFSSDLREINKTRHDVNGKAIVAALSFGFTLAVDISVNLQIHPTYPISFQDIISFHHGFILAYLFIAISMAYIITRTLVITTLPEETINPIADELKNARKNSKVRLVDFLGHEFLSVYFLLIFFLFLVFLLAI